MGNSNFIIEDSKPLPPKRKPKYPFAAMEVGQSFQIPITDADVEEHGDESTALARVRSAVSSSAAAFNRQGLGRKIVVRKTGERSLRCWCVPADY